MKQPLVSCIIPSYNRPEVVKRAIKSAVNQTSANKEIIVVDDGSDVEYDVNLPAWYYKPWEVNRGGSAARNYGISKAKGDYIVFIDDDNELHPEFLSKTVSNIGLRDAITTGRKIVYDDITKYSLTTHTKIPGIDWGWLMKKEVFDKIRWDESIWGDEDADLGIQFMKYFKYGIVAQVLQTAYALKEQDATANTYPTERRLRGLNNFLAKNLHVYKGDERRYILRLAGRNYLRAGHYFTAISYFTKSLMARKNLRTLWHLMFALGGWKVYNKYMDYYERKGTL